MTSTLALCFTMLLHACSALKAYAPVRNERLIGSSHSSARCDCTAITTNVDFQTYGRGGKYIPLVCIEHSLSEEAISGLRQDASSLRAAGFGAASGVASKLASQNIRHGVHQIWLQSPGSPSLQALVGSIDSRKELQRLIETIRQQLCNDDRILAAEFVELSYVFYDEGSFYKKHIDTIIQRNEKGFERCVSLILYLGDPSFDERPWDCELDGGALRVYNNDDGHADITPNPGTLVLFDSAVVPHEVMATYRPRTAIVGWFGKEIDSN